MLLTPAAVVVKVAVVEVLGTQKRVGGRKKGVEEGMPGCLLSVVRSLALVVPI